MRKNAKDKPESGAEDDAPNCGGRPSYKPTIEAQLQVQVWAAALVPLVEMARRLGIDKGTLEKHFANELADGPTKIAGDLEMALYRQANAGSVAAFKAWRDLVKERDIQKTASEYGAERPAEEAADDKPAQASRPAPLGKKEVAELEARTAGNGTEWEGDLLPPSTATH